MEHELVLNPAAEFLPAVYGTAAVARVLGLSVRSVQLMADRGEIQSWKTAGGHRRISRTSVLQWLLLPAGWDFDTLLGGQAAAVAAMAREGAPMPADQAEALDLPETATGYAGLLAKGFALLALGLAGLVTRRRARRAGAGA